MTKKILQLVVVLLFAAQGVMAQTVEIDNVVTAPGDIAVQVDMLNYTAMGSINLTIEFDNDLLNFTGIGDAQLSGITGNVNGNGNLIIAWFDQNGASLNGKLCDLLFEYKGGFSSALAFDTLTSGFCEVAGTDLAVIPSTFVDGSVTQSAAVGTVSMTALVDTVGNTVSMPVDMAGAAFDSVASTTFKIAFDEFRLSYAGIVEDAMTGVTANASGGMLTIEWDGSGSTMDFTSHHLFDILFVYNGGNADIVFVPGCVVSDVDLVPLAVDYTDGMITPAAGSASLTIGSVGATTDTVPVPVSVPIVADGFGTEILGAVTLNIRYDDARLTYTGFTKQQFMTGWVVNSSTSGLIEMQWSSLTGETLADGDFVTLNFDYDTIGGQADIEFYAGSIVKDVNVVTIPVSFFDGSVANHSVSGMLTYMGDASRPISTDGTSVTTVYLKNAADSSIAYTIGADVAGNYAFVGVAAGSYFLDATTTIDATYAYDVTDAFIINGIGGTLTGLQKLAADVNESTFVDATDAFIVWGSWSASYVKLAIWIAPDWFFENPSIVVSTDVSQDFSAICSGDANGSFIPIP